MQNVTRLAWWKLGRAWDLGFISSNSMRACCISRRKIVTNKNSKKKIIHITLQNKAIYMHKLKFGSSLHKLVWKQQVHSESKDLQLIFCKYLHTCFFTRNNCPMELLIVEKFKTWVQFSVIIVAPLSEKLVLNLKLFSPQTYYSFLSKEQSNAASSFKDSVF